jgi:hypothetical protein
MAEAKADDLEVLFPDRELTVAGEPLVVREYRYREGMAMLVLARPFLEGLRRLIGADGEVTPEDLDALIAEHADVWLALMARSCDRDVEWLAGLPDTEAMKLQMAFWAVNGPFFTRRLLFGAVFSAAAARNLSRRPKSSRASSGPDSAATRTTSPSASPGDRSGDSSRSSEPASAAPAPT